LPLSKKIETIYKPIGWLKPYTRNSRKHPASQIRKIVKSIQEIGFTNPILADVDGEIIAGHGRYKAAQHIELPEVPVIVLEGLTQAEKRAYVIADNKLAEDAQWDMDLLKAEIEDLQFSEDIDPSLTGFDIGEIAALDPTLIEDGGQVLADNEKQQMETEGQSDVENVVINVINEAALLPTDNDYGIPVLREDLLGDKIPQHPWYRMEPDQHPPDTVYLTWGEHRRERCKPEHTDGATLMFYEEDEAFEPIWNKKEDAINRMSVYNWGQVVAPDFSLHRDAPKAVRIYQYYRQQYMARFFQEFGFKVIPSLALSDERDNDFQILGIPKNPPIVACQVLTVYNKFTKIEGHRERSNFHKGINWIVEQLEPQNILFYGGLPHEERMRPHLPDGPDYHFLQSLSALFASKKGNSSWGAGRKIT